MSGEKVATEEVFESIRQIMSEDESVGQTALAGEDVLELTEVAAPDGERAVDGGARSGERTVAFSGADGRAALLSEAATAASAASFGALVSEVISRRDDSAAEDLVKEVMRPLIREWLDANLPALVERLVEREIRHLAETAEDRTC